MTMSAMRRELRIGLEPIDEPSLAAKCLPAPEVGAVVRFSGLVRGMEGDECIQGIEYEAFVRMARHQFGLLFDEVEKRWPIHSIRLVHRIGFVPVGEPSLWVEVAAAHRGEAFEACQHLIDQMKRVVPIWKKPQPPAHAVKKP